MNKKVYVDIAGISFIPEDIDLTKLKAKIIKGREVVLQHEDGRTFYIEPGLTNIWESEKC